MIYVYKLSRENRHLSYVPYVLEKNNASNYDNIDFEVLLNKFVNVNNFGSISKKYININFIKNVIGENERDFYNIYGDDESIEIAEYGKGCDFLIISCDTIQSKKHSIHPKECSIRSLAGIRIKFDHKNRKYTDLSLIVSAQPHIMKRRSNIKSFNGKEILKTIENISKKETCEYIKLSSIKTAISYYFKHGYRLKREYDSFENKNQQYYIEILYNLYKKSIETNKNYGELIMNNKSIMNFLKRYNSYNEYSYTEQKDGDYLMFKNLN